MYPISKEFSVNSLAKYRPHLRTPVIHVGSCETEHYNLSPLIAYEMQLEAVTPAHRPLPVSGKAVKHFVGKPAQVVAHGNHGGVYKSDSYAPSERVKVQEEHLLEENSALQFHKAVVGDRIWEVTL